MMDDTYSTEEFIRDVRELLATRPSTRDQLNEWWTRAAKVQHRFYHSHGHPDRIPDHIWRWLNDADLCFEDDEYARWLDEAVRRELEELSRTGGVSGD
jgi:hypothetical protein